MTTTMTTTALHLNWRRASTQEVADCEAPPEADGDFLTFLTETM